MHHDDAPHECDTHCGRPAPTTWICWDCLETLRTELNAFTPEDIAGLAAIGRKEEASAAPRTSQTGPRKAGPTIPLNLTAIILHTGITTTWPALLTQLPHQEDAATQWHHIRHQLHQARLMLHGEPPRWTEAEAAALLDQIEPMQTHTLVPWLREKCGIRLQPERVKKWAQAGHLQPSRIVEGKRPYYHPADVLRVRAAVSRRY